MNSRTRLVTVLAALLLLPAVGRAQAVPSAMPVLGYCGIPATQSTAARYLEMKECGIDVNIASFDTVEEVIQALQAADSAGVGLIPNCREFFEHPETAIPRVDGYKSLKAYFIKDEPRVADLQSVRAKIDAIRAAGATKPPYVNLFPYYDSELYTSMGLSSFEDYISQCVSAVDAPFISFDHYPVINGNDLRPTWYENLQMIRDESLRTGKPFWAFVLCTPHAIYPDPTPAHLRLQINVDLAYGAQAIQYFTYWLPDAIDFDYHKAPIDLDGGRTENYDKVRQANEELRKVAPLFYGGTIERVEHVDGSFESATINSASGAVASLLTTREGERYIVLVNKSLTESMKVKYGGQSHIVEPGAMLLLHHEPAQEVVRGHSALVPFAESAGIPRPEYPRPQFEREQWINLNGEWTYCFDFSGSGLERRLFESEGFEGRITVPFAPQCELSGVSFKDFIPQMWYQRKISVPADWAGRSVLLNFGAVDHIATVYVDGQLAGRHWGGSTPFSVDITRFVSPGGEHNLVVRVEDDERSDEYAQGKQSERFDSYGCFYTRTTGIWQTVWLEPVDPRGLEDAYIIPDLDQSRFVVEPRFRSFASGQKLRVRILDGEEVVSEKTVPASPQTRAELAVENVRTWSPEDPFLYGVELDVLDADGEIADHVESYAGMRKISIEGNRILLNDEPRYLRFVLDQGFYPSGTWTAPSDEALRHDIELSMAAGFNGARLHQKLFEPRFHYWADRLGYLTWGEFPSWGADVNRTGSARNFLEEWEEAVVRDRNHPSIIAWTPFNETWEHPLDREQARQASRLLSDVYRLTKALDYRPCHDVSGNYHVVTDIFTVHQYEQNPDKFREWLTPKDGRLPQADLRREVEYGGQPYLVDEYGGIKWIAGLANSEISWGYGEGPKTLEEYYARLRALTDVILDFSDEVCGYCYTQLTDVEQEQNGVYNYDRTEKFDMERIRAVFSRIPDNYK